MPPSLRARGGLGSDRAGLARDLAALALAQLGAVEDRDLAGPGVAAGAAAAGHAVKPGLAADEQVELVVLDRAAGVIGDHAAVVHVPAPGRAARHGAALEHRDI